MIASEEKQLTFNCFFFQFRKEVVVRRGQVHRISLVIKVFEFELCQLLLVFKCPGSHGIFVQEQDTLSQFPAAFASAWMSNIPH